MRYCDQLTAEELLSVRDAQPLDAALAQHTSECRHCQLEIARLRERRELLRSLPELSAPPLRLQSELIHGNRRIGANQGSNLGSNQGSNQEPSRRVLHLAAGFAAVAVASIVLTLSMQSQPKQVAATLSAEAAFAPSEAALNTAIDAASIGALVERSQQLEALLSMLPSSAIERAGTATTIDALQTQIQWLDFQLSVADEVGLSERQATELWQDRVGLLDALVKVKYADTQRIAML